MTQILTSNKSAGITGSTLKIIAIISMLIDHIGASLVEPYVIRAIPAGGTLFDASQNILIPYLVLRLIGRIAFPIFCFLIVEGFLHTHNLKNYMVRLFLFALISEVPFDLAFNGSVLEFSHQNVFFTLFLGLVAVALLTRAETVSEKGFFRICCNVAAILLPCAAAELLRTDYSAVGVLAIVLIYLYRNNSRTVQMLLPCVVLVASSVLEITAWLCIPLIRAYNGLRGIRIKYFFYAFYPGHLLILWLIGKYLLF